jgi:hypothetical protein
MNSTRRSTSRRQGRPTAGLALTTGALQANSRPSCLRPPLCGGLGADFGRLVVRLPMACRMVTLSVRAWSFSCRLTAEPGRCSRGNEREEEALWASRISGSGIDPACTVVKVDGTVAIDTDASGNKTTVRTSEVKIGSEADPATEYRLVIDEQFGHDRQFVVKLAADGRLSPNRNRAGSSPSTEGRAASRARTSKRLPPTL